MRRRAVRVSLRGGIGNQLFQYCAALALSIKIKSPLIIDTDLLPNQKTVAKDGVYSWPESISSFRHSGHLVRTNYGLIRRFLTTRLAQIERIMGDLFPRLLNLFSIYANEKRERTEFLLESTRPLKINSYCSSPRLFLEIEPIIKSQVSGIKDPSEWYLDMVSYIEEEKPLAIHVRLGDYKNLAIVYGIQNPEYFSAAIEIAQKMNGVKNILVFSDEPEKARELLAYINQDIRYINQPNDARDLESLLLMSKCAGLIASNSSFSWWAAFLMAREHPVIFPRPLFAEHSLPEPKYWLDKSWLQIGR